MLSNLAKELRYSDPRFDFECHGGKIVGQHDGIAVEVVNFSASTLAGSEYLALARYKEGSIYRQEGSSQDIKQFVEDIRHLVSKVAALT